MPLLPRAKWQFTPMDQCLTVTITIKSDPYESKLYEYFTHIS